MSTVLLTPAELAALVRTAVRAEIDATPRAEIREVLTRDQAADLLSCSPNVVSAYVRDKGLPGHRLGPEWRFMRSEVLAWMQSGKGAV